MSNEFPHIAEHMPHMLVRGDLPGIVDLYTLPAAVYLGNRVLVFTHRSELVAMLEAYRAILVRNGMVEARPEIRRFPRKNSSSTTFEMTTEYFREDGTYLGTGHVRYFVQKETNGDRIRLAEYVTWPCAKDIACDPVIASLSKRQNDKRRSHGSHEKGRPIVH